MIGQGDGRFKVAQPGAGIATYSSSHVIPHPNWDGNVTNGFDIALIRLGFNVQGNPPIKWTYNTPGLVNETSPGLVGHKAGFGVGGNTSGESPVPFPYGTFREATNLIDQLGVPSRHLRISEL